MPRDQDDEFFRMSRELEAVGFHSMVWDPSFGHTRPKRGQFLKARKKVTVRRENVAITTQSKRESFHCLKFKCYDSHSLTNCFNHFIASRS